MENYPACKAEAFLWHARVFCTETVLLLFLMHVRHHCAFNMFKKWRFFCFVFFCFFVFRYKCCQIISVELPWFNVDFGAQVLLQTPCDKILFSCRILYVISMFTMFILKFWHFIINENNVEGEIVTATPSICLFFTSVFSINMPLLLRRCSGIDGCVVRNF